MRRTVLLLVGVLIAGISLAVSSNSCVGRCGVEDGTTGCQCNSVCSQFGDCCSDFDDVCMTCKGRCGESFVQSKPCQCNDDCPSHGNCCSDYDQECGGGTGGGASDNDLRQLTEKLLSQDTNNVGTIITFDLQGKTSSSNTNDMAPKHLFSSVPSEALKSPTYQTFLALRDNYHAQVSITEENTPQEKEEIEAFLRALMDTKVMQTTEKFLLEHKLISGTLKDNLHTIWFELYSRASKSSSGIEHIMIGEIKKSKVSGFHNWISFYEEEQDGNLDYKGYVAIIDLGEKGAVLGDRFDWLGYHKSFGSMFIGTSPELELATYTVCFFARPSGPCPVQMANQRFEVITYPMSYGGKEMVGTAYPNVE